MFGFKKNEKPTLIIEAKDLMEIIKSDYGPRTRSWAQSCGAWSCSCKGQTASAGRVNSFLAVFRIHFDELHIKFQNINICVF